MSNTPTTTQAPQRRRSRTRYGIQLQEKQDLKSMFGIREEQLRKYYHKARRIHGETGPELVVLLERRLDNAIYRAGFAVTRPQARQMASHRIFAVNGRAVNIPSYELKENDVITVRDNKRGKSHFTAFEKRMQSVQIPSWLQINPEEYSIKIVEQPTFEEANLGVDIRAIIEYFAR